MPNDPNWNSAMSHMNTREEQARQDIQEVYENIRAAMGWMSTVAIANAWGVSEKLPREIGGLDRSAQKLANLLGVQPTYVRTYHDDGCLMMDLSGTPDEDRPDGYVGMDDGHDLTEGCEYADGE